MAIKYYSDISAQSVDLTGSVTFTQSGAAFINHNVTSQSVKFRLSNSSALDVIPLEITPTYMVANKDIYLVDDVRLRAGTGGDFSFFHDGSNSKINNNTGNIRIENFQDDGDIQFFTDDGSGSTTEYLRIDGGEGRLVYTANSRYLDNVIAMFGSGADLQIYHDGSNNYIQGVNGDLYIQNGANDKDVILRSDDGSGGQTAYITLDGSATEILLAQTTKAQGTNLTVQPSSGGNGQLNVTRTSGATTFIQSQSAAGIIGTSSNHKLDVKTNDATRFSISNTGAATFSGSVTVGVDDTGYDVKLFGATSGRYMEWDESADSLILVDNVQLQLGSSSDIRMLHDGTDSKIRSTTSDLYITQEANDKDIIFQSDDNSGGVTPYLTLDGSAGYTTAQKEIRFQNGIPVKFGSSAGAQISHDSSSGLYFANTIGDIDIYNFTDDGDISFYSDDGSGGTTEYFRVDGGDERTIFSKHTKHLDNAFFAVGTGGDFTIDHDGSNTSLQNSTGELRIKNYADDSDIVFQCDDGSGGVTDYIRLDGSSAKVLVNRPSIFYDTIEMASYIYHNGDTNTYFGFSGADTYTLITGGTTALTVNSSQAATFAGDVQAAGLYVGATNTSFDFYNNGTSYLNGATTIDDNTQINGTLTVGADGAGHDVKFFLNASGRYIMVDEDDNSLIFTDNASAKFGNGGDLQLMHDGTDSRIDNMVGHLKIRNYSDNSDIIFETDNGSGSTTTYLTLDGGFSTPQVRVPDNVTFSIGNSQDLRLEHDGSDSKITQSGTGNLIIRQTVNDADLILQCDDGSGGETAYLELDGSESMIMIYKSTRMSDNHTLQIGSGADLRLTHDATHSYITNYTGNFYLDQATNDADLILQCDDGLGGLTPYITLDGSATKTVFSKETLHSDSVKAKFGTSGDLEIQHNGSASVIDNLTGSLLIRCFADDSDIIFQSDDGSGGVTNYFVVDGSAEQTRFYKDTRHTDGIKANFGNSDDLRIQHASGDSSGYIQNYTGNLNIQNLADDKDIIFKCDDGSGGQTAYITLDGSASVTKFDKITQHADNVAAKFGYGNDLVIYHDGTNNHITADNGDLTFTVNEDDHDIIFKSDDGSGGTAEYFRLWGLISSILVSKDVLIGNDTAKLKFGASQDLQLYHNGTDSYIHNDTGDLRIENDATDGDIVFRSDNGSGGLSTYFRVDGGLGKTIFPDNQILGFGSSADLQLWHGGVDSYITNEVGDLYLIQKADDKDLILSSDDGSGGHTPYITLDGSAGNITVAKDMVIADNKAQMYGTGGDAFFKHTGSAFSFFNDTGDVTFTNRANDKDITFQSDDGSGGTATYFRLDGSEVETRFLKATLHFDSVQAKYGDSGDLQIQHNGTDSQITNSTGHLQFTNTANNSDISFASDNGAGSDAIYFFLDGGAATHDGSATTALFTNWPDKSRVTFGNLAGGDMAIYHDGTDNYHNHYTGDVYFRNNADDKDIIFQSDNGSGGVATYFFLDGSATQTTFQLDTRHNDSVEAKFGDGSDLKIKHDGSDSFVRNFTGDFYILNAANDKDIIFQCDDGSGGIETYFFLDGSASGGNPVTIFPDSSTLRFGSGGDLQLYHDGANSYVAQTGTGDLYIRNTTDDKDIIFQSDDGSGGVATYFKLDGSSASGGTLYTQFPDNSNLTFGSADDLQIKHDGTDSKITNSTGDLVIRNLADDKDIIFQSDDGAGGVAIYFQLDGSQATHDGSATTTLVTQWPDNSKIAVGAGTDGRFWHDGSHTYLQNTTGDFIIQNFADDKDIIFKSDDGSGGTTAYITLDGSQGFTTVQKDMQFADDIAAKFGAGNDLRIDHNGSDSSITNNTGDLVIKNNTDDGDIIFKSDDGSGGTQTYLTIDGGADRTIFSRSSRHADGVVAAFGASEDLQIYHDGSNSYIVDGGTGSLKIQTSQITINNAAGNEAMINATQDGAVNLYYNGQGPKVSTGTYGPTFKYSVTGTTDGNSAGDIVHLGETTTVAGKIYYYKSDGEWGLVDADAESTAKGMLAVALGTSSSTNGMLIRGMVTLDHDPGTVGNTLFLSTTPGTATWNPPSGSGDIVRVIGYCLDSTNGQIYFNPDGAFVEVA